ncbi:ATP-BINDING CASSETTE SUB-FAMILY B [Salix purpurea]|uniref:ATP-BINDING CASSETTE SUB-FAMILY B n=1 Tax=Salix purpurea TaxID=77065 RepID=A0A9Q0QFY5_SALPP|nr:ATP-BINDING CASSETTE SUB-FAMILY B [Salix purpurea]
MSSSPLGIVEDNEKKKEEKKKKQHKVPFWKLFAFADSYDYVLMGLGSLGACVHGASVPVFFIFFGKLINIIGLAYLFPKEASHRVAKYSLDFVYLSVVILFASWIVEFNMEEFNSCDSTVKVSKAVGQDNLPVFSCDLISMLASGMVGNFLHYISRFLGGFIIGFVRIWQISLVTLSIVPLIALAGGVYAYITIGLIAKVRKSYVKASQVAEEVIGNVRTVHAFAGEEKAVRSYIEALRKTYNYGWKAGLAKGLGLGTLHCVLFLSWALLVWYTSIVVHKNIANGGESFTTMLNVVISGLSLGMAAPDVSSFLHATAAAYPIFEMIEKNTMSKISSESGRKVDRVDGHIEFKDVCFRYPSRPDEAASLQRHPSLGPTLGRPLSIKYSRELSHTRSSFGASFGSDKDSVSWAGGDASESTRTKNVSLKRLYSMVGPDWIYGVLGTIGAFIAGAQMPLFALGVSQALVSYYMDWDTTRHEVKKIAILFCCGAGTSVIVYAIEHLSFGIMGERLTLRVREMMFSAILRNEIGWFDDLNNTSSMLTSRLESDATLLRTIVVDRSTILLHNVGLIVTSFIIAFTLNWRITLVVIATYPLIISGHISEKLFMKGYGGNLSKAYLKANMLAGEAVSNIRTVAAFCAEEKILDLYARELVEPSKNSFTRGQIAGIFYGICQFFIFSSYGLALWYGSVLMDKELAGFKSIMKSFMVLIVTALAMGETLALAPDLLKGNHMAASVFEILDRKTRVMGDVGEELKNVEGTIELRGVQFSYPSRPDALIFKDFDLKVRSGKSIALVGQSGSGKSSVLALILRFYDPTAGKVMIDGIDIKKLKVKSLRKHIGLVQQEPALFAASIYENILYGKEGASEAELVRLQQQGGAEQDH